MAFCKEYNAKTADKIGQIIPVAITVYDVSAPLRGRLLAAELTRFGACRIRASRWS
jgi:hypothetical protein